MTSLGEGEFFFFAPFYCSCIKNFGLYYKEFSMDLCDEMESRISLQLSHNKIVFFKQGNMDIRHVSYFIFYLIVRAIFNGK